MPERVGVRELRQNLSVYLRRVRAGERLTVTEHNVPVAELVPLHADDDPFARLVAEGRIVPARRSLRDLPPAVEVTGGAAETSRVLDEIRDDRIQVPGAAYADASALVKLVLDEAGSAEMRAVATTLDHLVVSEIGDVEVGLTVRRRGGDAAGDTWADVLDRLDLVPLSPTLRRAATDLATTNLRALDTIHLATALSVAGLTDRFLCYDTRLSAAARAAGLRVEGPGEPTG